MEGIDAVLRRLGGTARRWRVDRMATVIVPGTGRIQPSFVGVLSITGWGWIRANRGILNGKGWWKRPSTTSRNVGGAPPQ